MSLEGRRAVVRIYTDEKAKGDGSFDGAAIVKHGGEQKIAGGAVGRGKAGSAIMRSTSFSRAASAMALVGVAVLATTASADPAPRGFQPPPQSAIPPGPFGETVKLGEAIFRDPAAHAQRYVGNDLKCANCHLDGGRLANSSPMWGAYVSYPAYRKKNDHVNTFAERLQGCFRYSMNGKAPPLGDPVLVALESYAYFLAKGLPTGEEPAGRGYPELPKPAQAPDYSRGAALYGQRCAACHGGDGAGQKADGKVVFPPLWGPRSFNWGAGMASIEHAAAFIRANMPLGQGGTLTPQQAWDVAAFVDSRVRPQDPRFTGDVAKTRKQFHDTDFSMYGQSVNGKTLGDPATTPPADTVPRSANAK